MTNNLQPDAIAASAGQLNAPVIARIQARLREALAAAVPSFRHYAVLDYPNYANIGDSAIYLGEAILLEEVTGRKPDLVAETGEWSLKLAEAQKWDGPLFLQGGGNFGDLWPRHQIFREEVLRRFPDRQVVQLPQTLHFKDPENVRRAAAVIKAHPRFTLMVRDHASLALARDAFECDVQLVPDMAFMIGAVPPSRAPDHEMLCLIREDQETMLADTHALDALGMSHLVVDWPEELPAGGLRLPRALRQHLPPAWQGRRPVTSEAYEWLARKRLNTGLEILSRGHAVLTDRLHAHILSLLLGKPHVVMDNSYGKISSFITAWTEGGAFSQAAALDEAVEKAKLVRQGQGYGAAPGAVAA